MEFDYKNKKFHVEIIPEMNCIVATRKDNLKANDSFDNTTQEPIKSYNYSDLFTVELPLSDYCKDKRNTSELNKICFQDNWDKLYLDFCAAIDLRIR